MKTDYKHIYFVDLGQESEHAAYACYNNSDRDSIGLVAWHNRWMQYCFFPDPHTAFSANCHDDIAHFIRQLK